MQGVSIVETAASNTLVCNDIYLPVTYYDVSPKNAQDVGLYQRYVAVLRRELEAQPVGQIISEAL